MSTQDPRDYSLPPGLKTVLAILPLAFLPLVFFHLLYILWFVYAVFATILLFCDVTLMLLVRKKCASVGNRSKNKIVTIQTILQAGFTGSLFGLGLLQYDPTSGPAYRYISSFAFVVYMISIVLVFVVLYTILFLALVGIHSVSLQMRKRERNERNLE